MSYPSLASTQKQAIFDEFKECFDADPPYPMTVAGGIEKNLAILAAGQNYITVNPEAKKLDLASPQLAKARSTAMQGKASGKELAEAVYDSMITKFHEESKKRIYLEAERRSDDVFFAEELPKLGFPQSTVDAFNERYWKLNPNCALSNADRIERFQKYWAEKYGCYSPLLPPLAAPIQTKPSEPTIQW